MRHSAQQTVPHRQQPRRGMTLVELLVVVGVMVILMSISLPMIKNGLAGRKTREASRQLSTYVELAKGQVVATGRPAGLLLETEALPEDPTKKYATRVFLTQSPAPYTGDMAHAKVGVAAIDRSTGTATLRFDPMVPSTAGPVPSTDSLLIGSLGIGAGDLIRLDYKGPFYRITAPASVTAYNVAVTIAGQPLPPGNPVLTDPTTWTSYSYQIYRQPVRAGSRALELTGGAVIDLSGSGYGLNDTSFASAATPISIVFGTSGGLTDVIFDGVRLERTDTVHLFVGEIDKLGTENLQDPDSRWVSIGYQTGKVTVAENGWTTTANTLADAREYAQSAQSSGGR